MSDIDNVSWNYPTPIWFGLGRSLEIPNALEAQGMQNPLVVTDPEFTSNKNFIKIIELLKNNKIKHSIFSNIKGNPTGKNVMDGVEHFLSNNNDGVIAIGGGSSLDAGKAIAFMTKQKENLWFFEDIGDNWTKAITDQLPKVIAIPTTAGTGSETGRASLILDESDKTKKIIFHPSFLPDLVILDPNLTLSLPPHLTAATGMDALAHCLEAYCARGFHPMADGIALEGGIGLILLSLGARYLPAAEFMLLSLTEVVGGVIWCWIPLFGVNEVPSNITLMGGLVIIIAISFYAFGTTKKTTPPTL